MADELNVNGHFKVVYPYNATIELIVQDIPELYPNYEFVYCSALTKRSICGNLIRFLVLRLKDHNPTEPLTLEELERLKNGN